MELAAALPHCDELSGIGADPGVPTGLLGSLQRLIREGDDAFP